MVSERARGRTKVRVADVGGGGELHDKNVIWGQVQLPPRLLPVVSCAIIESTNVSLFIENLKTTNIVLGGGNEGIEC